MKRILWCIFSLALIVGLLLSVNLADSLASFRNVGTVKSDLSPENAGIIKGDFSAGIIKGDFSAGIIKGDFSAGIIKGDFSAGIIKGDFSAGIIKGDLAPSG
jgi:LytS/YehU family sensor histidine kinase